MVNAYEEYMKAVVTPMRKELTDAGFEELLTPEDVDRFMENAGGTTLVFVNSVCGCAAGLARPAARESLNHEVKPDRLVTVFAGQDKEATEQMRSYFTGYEPSSPSMALLKGKEVVHFIPREEIEYHEPEEVVANLVNAYDQYCR
ncbi:MAG TPA: BrxA/BrxB family bacilliredoxin [Bacillales bacterium]|nr:BrxA/BrxB family bacilliredoxin [Bacillales bacterium]